MAIQASSLEHLYNQGILNYVPYDLCQPTAPTYQNGMGYGQYGQNGQYGQLVQAYGNPNNQPLTQAYASPYLQQAQQGNLYNTYTGDTFVPRNLQPQENQYSFKKNAFGIDDGAQVQSFRQQILSEANSTNNDVTKREKKNSFGFWKGLLAGGILVGTLVCILKGKKPPKP